jgi:nucleoside phosphorylase
MAGLAGALDPALEVGDVVVDGDVGPLLPHRGWRRGAIHTSGEIVATAAAKQALFAATGALVVDMESAVAREFAASRSVPFLSTRAVSDRAADALDPATLDWVDAAGGLRPAKLAADLCRRPGTIPDLVRLGIRSRTAMRSLSDAVLHVVRSGWATDARAPQPSGSTA